MALWFYPVSNQTELICGPTKYVVLAADYYQNARDLGWPIARGAYKVIVTEMEAVLVSWE